MERKKTGLALNSESWDTQHRKRFQNLFKTIVLMTDLIEENGFLVRRYALHFREGNLTCTIYFGGVEFLNSDWH